ncbi:MAG: META domain-containing protein [Bacteroidota bacterium]
MVLYRKLWYVCISLGLLAGGACSAPPALQGVITPDKLRGTQWQLNSYGAEGPEARVVDGVQVTLAFTGQNQVGGTDGCSIFAGEYEIAGSRITFRNMTSRQVNCSDQKLLHQESQYIGALNDTVKYSLQGDHLIIWYGEGRYMLNFSRSVPPGLVGGNIGTG